MGSRIGTKRTLVGLVATVAMALCIAGGMALTAFAQPLPADNGRGMAATNVTLAAQDGDAVSYIERSLNGNDLTSETKSCTDYIEVTENTTTFSNDSWYVVKGDVTDGNRISVSGTSHLILCDGATLEATNGIQLTSGNTLNIYPGSTGDNVEGTGAMRATIAGVYDYKAGIGGGHQEGGGNMTVHGGNVEARGNYYGAGIGGGQTASCGTITVNGGTVTATGGSWGAGIGGGGNRGAGGTVVVNGGTVIAESSDGKGIGGGRGSDNHGALTIRDGLVLYGGDGYNPTTQVEKTGNDYERFAHMTIAEPSEYIKMLIEDLPDPESVTTYGKAEIEAVRAAYDALTDAQKARVGEDARKKLEADEAALIDAAAVDAFGEKMDDLPYPNEVTADSKTAIEAVRAAYDALTDGQKKRLDGGAIEFLKADEAALAIVELPEPDKVTTANKDAIRKARAAYDPLEDTIKSEFFIPNLEEKLAAAEKRLSIVLAISEVSARTVGDVVYTGKAIQLVNTPTTVLPEGFSMQYAVAAGSGAPGASAYSATVPTAIDQGAYNVWCKVVGEGGQDAVEPKRIVATIGKAPLTITIPTAAKTYNGKAQTQTVKVTGNKAGKAAQTLVAGTDYDVKYANNVNAGTATVTVTAKSKNYSGSGAATFKIAKAANPMTATVKTKSAAATFNAKKAATINAKSKKLYNVAKAQGKVTYSLASVSGKATKAKNKSKFKVAATSGNIAVAKGTPADTYTVKVNVKAAGNANYNAKTVKNLVYTITVKKAANPIKISAKARSFKVAMNKTAQKSSKNTKFKAKKLYKVARNLSKGAITYTIVVPKAAKKFISINKKNGAITVKKGLKKGNYTVKVKATQAAKGNYKKSGAKSVKLTFQVK